ncbi:MAG TPA: hypothetical protein VIH00_10325, partial [Candidatus Limnocylindrales bacterium]
MSWFRRKGEAGSLRFSVHWIDLSRSGLRGADRQAGFGYGPGLVVHPDDPVAYFGRPWGWTPSPWTMVDLTSGAFSDSQGRNGIPGDLRDGFVTAGGGTAWILGSHGVAEMSLVSMAPIRVFRTGIGRYLWRLFDVRPDLLGATGWITRSIALISTEDGVVERRVPIRSPDLVVPTDRRDEAWLV